MPDIILADLVTRERIILRLQARGRSQAVRALARPAARDAGLDADRIHAAVMAHGDLTSFGIGRGLALPHATVEGLRRPLGVLAMLATPVDFGAADGHPSDLALLILAPAGEEITLLRALSCAARRLRDREVAAKLRGATTAEAAHVVLTSDAWRSRSPAPPAAPRRQRSEMSRLTS